ncbi:2-amino-4-hydroxy-6-hydroxymethyldihydropteridine diphosphokinase [Pueribacillus theae]|uniref:2-amino-4-hydroxy-6-hydroxymethyldihydropteridine diphosphokinase n=1 Tax=Pueribacillus theae TaxID=2171751 RepID=A0A2U1K3N7_9BACI|nr:2-amino-4-hydroxy-6-hydroxymethyldihydropteridine diphosphokinase [Pueribacillus theae]
MAIAYIGLGSNIGNRDEYLYKALKALGNDSAMLVRDVSSIYETDPVGFTEQPAFLNMVAEIETSLQPLELLASLQKIEDKLGRTREIKWGPRTIDLDILLYNQETVKSERLIIPHPRMKERGFVLIPLFELAPHLSSCLFNDSAEMTDEKVLNDGVRLWKKKNESGEYGLFSI